MKFGNQHFTNHFGFSTDYFSAWMHSQRKTTYVDAVGKFFTYGSQLKRRDTKPIEKTVSGLIKLLHPDGQYTKEDVREYLIWALEMRRRVKEQLKRIGGMEFWDTNFSFIDNETQEEVYINVPEERGNSLIENSPLAPGLCYTATSNGNKVSLVKIEVAKMSGSGKLDIRGGVAQEGKDDIHNVYNYIRSNERSFLPSGQSLRNIDLTIQVTSLLGLSANSGIGAAVFVAIVSALFDKNIKPALGVIGSISIGGAVERALNFSDKVSMLSDNGAKTVIVPMDNLPEMSSLPSTILGKTDVPFFANAQMLMQKML